MYKNQLNRILTPFNFFSSNTTKYGTELVEFKDKLDKWNYDDISLKPVKNFLDNNGIITKIQVSVTEERIDVNYPYIYTTKISNAWIENFKLSFYLNGKDIKEYLEQDIKILLFQGHVYICFKVDTQITSLVVMRTNLPAKIEKLNGATTLSKKGNILEIPYNDNFEYNPVATTGNKLVINQPYFIIEPGENVFEVLDQYTDSVDWLFNNKITSYLVIDEDDGIVGDSADIEIDPFYFSVKNTSNKNLILFYDGIDPEDYVEKPLSYFENENYHLEYVYRHILSKPSIRQYLITNKDLLVKSEEINVYTAFPDYSQMISPNVIDELAGFSYDLFMDLFRLKHRTKINFGANDLYITEQTKFSEFDYNDNTLERKLVRLSFSNYMNNPFEIYIFNKLYQGTYITDHHNDYTTVYINISNILDYYDINMTQFQNIKGHVVLKNKDYYRMNYNNIDSSINGTLPISQEWYSIQNKLVFDNGFLLRPSDYTVNSIYPSGLFCLWPKIKQKNHLVTITGNRGSSAIVNNKKYTVKIKNFTQTEIDDKKTPNKYIYKNLMYTDYIDFRYNIYIGPYLLMEGFDYIILAPNLIEFIRPIGVYKDMINDEYIEIMISYEGEMEDWLLKIGNNKSYKYRLFNNDTFMAEYYETREDTSLIYERTNVENINVPELYDDNIYRYNQMMTKYYSSEILFTAEKNNPYGDEFYNLLHTEFSEFVTKVDNDWVIQTNYQANVKDAPRRIFWPERVNLNELIKKHVEVVKILQHENKTFQNEYELDDIFYRYKVTGNFKGDLLLSPNIPVDYILEKY